MSGDTNKYDHYSYQIIHAEFTWKVTAKTK